MQDGVQSKFKKDEVLQCVFCKKWLKFYNLLTHLRTIHGEEGIAEARNLWREPHKSVSCPAEGCSYLGTSKDALRRHTAKAHPTIKRRTRHAILCTLCKKDVGDQEGFNEHCYTEHGDEACRVQFISLESVTAFQVWKESMEKGFCTFWKEAGLAKMHGYTLKYFKCNRAGKYVPRGRGLRIPHKTMIDTQYCTSFVKAKFYNEGNVDVRFCTRHSGHSPSVAPLALSTSDKERKELLDSIKTRLHRLYAIAQSLSVREKTEEIMRKLDNDVAQIENQEYGIPASTLVPIGNDTAQRSYGTPRGGILGHFDRLIERPAHKTDVKRTEFYCKLTDTDAQNLCGICYEEHPQVQEWKTEEMFVGWWSCDSCNVWMHRDCISSKQCPICFKQMEPDELEIL
ncbi:hypothetical protein RB195_000177 [Necator americanus]|uniref:C2H2-type domain-containing protein n=1 Tax=Necator americanus TaxID=51031 RepID=A0ABR1D961_NECAM